MGTTTIGRRSGLRPPPSPFLLWLVSVASVLIGCGSAPAAPGPQEPPPTLDVEPGENLQALIDRNPPGTTFRLGAGVHRRESVSPKHHMAFIGEEGAVLDGEGEVLYAFLPTADSIVIRNLEIRNFTNPQQFGAVRAGGQTPADGRYGWIVEDCEIHGNVGGIRIGHGMVVSNNNIHHNRQIGVAGIGDDVLVEGNIIAYNNFEREYDPGFEAGGIKIVLSNRVTVRDNFVHHNTGPGLWTDVQNREVLYEGNVVEDNSDSGIFHEVSFDAIIRNNTIRRNGWALSPGGWAYGAGIVVAHSSDVEVYENVVEHNFNGITGIQQRRGEFRLDRLSVYDNRIVVGDGQWAAGVVQDIGSTEVFERDITFRRNEYILPADGPFFVWNDGAHRQEAWQAFGHDTDGVFTIR